MNKKLLSIQVSLGLAMITVGACSEGGDEPVQISLPVATEGSGLDVCENDLGWQVTLDELRLAVRDLEFTIEGETHVDARSAIEHIADWLVPNAWAHPGHYAGGDVTGELRGDFLLDLFDTGGVSLGSADLLEGDYNGFNLTFRTAGETDGLSPDDPLLGHTAVMAGSASASGQVVPFTAVVDVAEGVQMVGGVFELDADKETEATLLLEVLTIDPFEGDTLFDGIDFGALEKDSEGSALIAPGSEAHNVLMKTLIRHDHYQIKI